MQSLSRDPEAATVECASWSEVLAQLEEFPPPTIEYDSNDSVSREEWIFRGLAEPSYKLEPTIEREAKQKGIPWSALERLVSTEFKSRSRMHLEESSIPAAEDEFTWLAQMQHYGIPTRLLDFTYSPFVALYFAVRGCGKSRPKRIRLWAINATALNRRFTPIASRALEKDRRRRGKAKFHVAGMDPDTFSTLSDDLRVEIQGLLAQVASSLSASGSQRGHLKRHGAVAAAAPPAFNPRLASQQGVFLVNCAEILDLRESLNKMMKGVSSGWCKQIRIDGSLIPEVEKKLFQMNIHEQSMFPDMEGLAGLIRQKIRLHWF